MFLSIDKILQKLMFERELNAAVLLVKGPYLNKILLKMSRHYCQLYITSQIGGYTLSLDLKKYMWQCGRSATYIFERHIPKSLIERYWDYLDDLSVSS